MRLIDALRVKSTARIAFVGSGGKTSAVLRLGVEYPSPAILSNTAHFSLSQTRLAGKHFIWNPSKSPDLESVEVNENLFISGPQRDEISLFGVDPSQWGLINRLGDTYNAPIFLEADGSKARPLKAPTEHEPPIPDWVNHVVVSVGLSVLGKILNSENVHRPELFSNITGLALNQPVTVEAIIRMLISPKGGLKNIPPAARRTVLLNQIDMLKDKSVLQKFDSVLNTYDSVVFASLQGSSNNYSANEHPDEVEQVKESSAAIILAAGSSRRMGKTKALMDWGGIPFVRVCALQAISAGLRPVFIIVGRESTEIADSVNDLPVDVIINHEWQAGQAGSIRAGINCLPEKVGSVIFQLVDQPQIPSTLLRQLVKEHSLSLASIILPESGGQRANPVLFDRRTFSDLCDLQGDIGGRGIFSKYRLKLIPWNDETILLDVDTPEDYKTLLSYFNDK